MRTYRAGAVVETYILVQCGSPGPNPEDLPAGAKIFEIPLYRVAVQDTTVNEFLVGILDLSLVSAGVFVRTVAWLGATSAWYTVNILCSIIRVVHTYILYLSISSLICR